MDHQAAKDLIDACHEARHLVGLLPSLPSELSSIRLKTLDAVLTLSERNADAPDSSDAPDADGGSLGVRVSAIARMMGTTTPGVTRTVNELAARGDVRKRAGTRDGRAVLVEPTEQGRATHRLWVREVDDHVAEILTRADLTEEDVAVTARTIHRALQALAEADLQRWQDERIG